MTTTQVANEASKKNGNAKAPVEGSAEGSSPTLAAVNVPKGFTKVGVERNFYKSDTKNPIQGLLLGLVELPNKGNKPGKDGRTVWDAFILRLTAPCTGLNKDKNEVSCVVGDELIVPANYKLKQTFASQANRSDLLFEVFIQPTKKVDIGGGQTMQLFETAVSETVRKRDGSNILMGNRLAAQEVRTTPALGMGEAIGDSDIPF